MCINKEIEVYMMFKNHVHALTHVLQNERVFLMIGEKF